MTSLPLLRVVGYLLEDSQFNIKEIIKPFLVLQSARAYGKWERLSWGIRIVWLVVFGFVLSLRF